MHLLISILYSECSMNNPNDLSNQVISPEEIVVESTGATSSMNVIELTAIINRYAADIDKIKGSLKEKMPCLRMHLRETRSTMSRI